MKKVLLTLVFSVSSVFGINLGLVEVSPEFGVDFGKASIKNGLKQNTVYSSYGPSNYGFYGRVWVGAFGIVLAPQVKYDFYSKSSGHSGFSNAQYGLNLGTNFGLVVMRLTPYLGVSRSSFNKIYKDTFAYRVGLKVTPAVLPLAVSLQYTYQKPEVKGVSPKHSTTMSNIQLMIGLHF